MKIIGFDYPCMDMNIFCTKIPHEEELTELKDVSLMGGGKVANAIIAAARLGAKTGFAGVIGSDRYGSLCRKDLEKHGTDVSHLLVKPGHTALCLSIVDEEKRGKHYIESKPTFETMTKTETEILVDCFAEEVMKGDYLMLFQMDECAQTLAKAFKKAGGLVEVDGDEFDERTQNTLPLIDIFIMSEYYYTSCYPEADLDDDRQLEENLKKISIQGPDIVVVTIGSKGCAGIDKGRFFRTKSYRVQAKDTTGAGDVFHGAFVYGLSQGKNGEEAAIFASAVSAVKCTILGGRTGIPDLECVEHFIKSGEITEADFNEREEYYRRCMWEE